MTCNDIQLKLNWLRVTVAVGTEKCHWYITAITEPVLAIRLLLS